MNKGGLIGLIITGLGGLGALAASYYYEKTKYDKDGYDKDGFDQNGYNRFGYNKDGYDKHGYDIDGYNKNGYDIDGYNSDGLDREGYNKLFLNSNNKDRAGNDNDFYSIELDHLSGILERARKNYNKADFRTCLFDTRTVFENIIRFLVIHFIGSKKEGEDMLENLKIIEKIGLIDEEEISKYHSVRTICNKLHDARAGENVKGNEVYFALKSTEELFGIAKKVILESEFDKKVYHNLKVHSFKTNSHVGKSKG